MDGHEEKPLEERVARLEKALGELRRLLGQPAEPQKEAGLQVFSKGPEAFPVPAAKPAPGPVEAGSAARRKLVLPEAMYKSEYWLGKIGIGLLLFGVVFLFKYSIDRGWLTEPVRVGFGLALGTVLFVIGARIHAGRRHFSQVLLGGAFATLYITGFAAFQLYQLVSWPQAFAFMIGVTLLTFYLSLTINEMALSLIGTIGGLATPFLLYTPEGSLPGLVFYTCMLLGGAAAIYLYRGWRSLLWTSAFGGLVTYIIIAARHVAEPGLFDRWAVQSGVAFAWLAFWAVPVIREAFQTLNPARWPVPPLDFLRNPAQAQLVYRSTPCLLTVVTPLVALAYSVNIWRLSGETWGWIILAGSLLYGVVFLQLQARRLEKPAYTHAVMALFFLTVAFCLLLEGKVLFLTLAAEAAALHLVSHRLDNRIIETCGHALSAIVWSWLAAHLIAETFRPEGTVIFNAQALTDLAVIVAMLGVSYRVRAEVAVKAYRLAAHLAVLGWLLRELSALPEGQAYVTIAWGIYAITLLLPGLRLNLGLLRLAGLGTLFLVVGKLFLVDLASLEAIWRILLFLFFGGVFLLLSFYFRTLWKAPAAGAGT